MALVTCPNCHIQTNARPEDLGRPVICPTCGRQFAAVPDEPLPPAPPPGVPPPAYAPSLPPSGMATASLVLGVCSIPFCMCYGVPGILFGILGIIFSHLARKEIAAGTRAASSRSLATAGQICGWIGVALGLLYLLGIAAYIAAVFGIALSTGKW